MTLKLQDPTLLKTQVYINGEWVDGDAGESFPVLNPAKNGVAYSVFVEE